LRDVGIAVAKSKQGQKARSKKKNRRALAPVFFYAATTQAGKEFRPSFSELNIMCAFGGALASQ